MDIQFSDKQILRIERIYNESSPAELAEKKKTMFSCTEGVILRYARSMNIISLLDTVLVDIPAREDKCYEYDASERRATVYIKNIENELETQNRLIHQLGHIQDITVRKFDLAGFETAVYKNRPCGYALWDAFLDARLCGDGLFPYFRKQSLYYEHRILIRSLAANISVDTEALFEKMWQTRDYGVGQIAEIFGKLCV